MEILEVPGTIISLNSVLSSVFKMLIRENTFKNLSIKGFKDIEFETVTYTLIMNLKDKYCAIEDNIFQRKSF